MDRYSNYQKKYLKYKSKYLELKRYSDRLKYNMKGGVLSLLPVEQIEKIHDTDDAEQYGRYSLFREDVEKLKELFSVHKNSVNSNKKGLTLKSNSQFKVIHDTAKAIALREGTRLYSKWSNERGEIIAKILANFDDDGNVLPDISEENKLFFNSATWFNDLYKWTMYPVMRFIEKQEKFGNKPIHVKFQVDIREPSVRNALKDPIVREKVFEALQKLKDRTFEQDVFEQVSREKGNIISDDDINAICFKGGQKRNLVQEVSDQQNAQVPEDGVVIRCFYKEDLHYDVPIKKSDGSLENVGESGLLVIEAEGPWHLVTWLETSMMQCVYQAYHKHILSTKEKSVSAGEGEKKGEGEGEGEKKGEDNGAYKAWLSRALLRCATSVAYTRIMHHLGGPTPALFTGRRTGGLPFLILQNLLFIDHFKQFVPVVGSKPTIGLYSHTEEATPCLGTSSVDAVLYLRTLLLLPENGESRGLMKRYDPKVPNVLPFVGTHAHELSMVLSVLYHDLDVNPLQLPFSQVLGHYLYEEIVRKKTLGPLPMLSDTLGTPAFVIAATILLQNNCIFLSFINSARQDSGDLVDFEDVLDKIEYKGSCMASEIDDTVTLLKASCLSKFNTFGAGGFFGDSNKVFDEKGTNISMAVKVVRVECTYNQEPITEDTLPPNVTISDSKCIGYPIKTGDPSDINDEEGRQQISKFSADKTLASNKLIDMKDYAIEIRENATKMLLSSELLSQVKAQVRRDVITVKDDVLTINTIPLQTLKPVFKIKEEVVEVGGGKSKRTMRK